MSPFGRVVRQFAVLTQLTASETARQPICLLLAASCVVVCAATPLLLAFDFGEEGKLARDAGLALHFAMGTVLAGYAACSALGREMRGGTAAAVLSKPVNRGVFFLSKFAGTTLVVLLFSFCAALATLLSERAAEKFSSGGRLAGYVIDWQTGFLLLIAPLAAFAIAGLMNYFWRRPFGSSAFMLLAACLSAAFVASGFFDRAGRWYPFDFAVQWRILPCSMLVSMSLVLISAIAITLTTRLKPAPTVTGCIVVLALGLMSDYLFGRHASGSSAAWAAYGLLPNFQHFWAADALTGGGTVPWRYVLNAGLYASAYTGGVLCFGAFLFGRSEVG